MDTDIETVNVIPFEEAKKKAIQLFQLLDVSETTRKDYASRIGLFISHVGQEGFNRNSYLNFKRYLETRADYTVATKNKYLATAKVFLKELNRLGTLPADITQNIKLFNQNKGDASHAEKYTPTGVVLFIGFSGIKAGGDNQIRCF